MHQIRELLVAILGVGLLCDARRVAAFVQVVRSRRQIGLSVALLIAFGSVVRVVLLLDVRVEVERQRRPLRHRHVVLRADRGHVVIVAVLLAVLVGVPVRVAVVLLELVVDERSAVRLHLNAAGLGRVGARVVQRRRLRGALEDDLRVPVVGEVLGRQQMPVLGRRLVLSGGVDELLLLLRLGVVVALGRSLDDVVLRAFVLVRLVLRLVAGVRLRVLLLQSAVVRHLGLLLVSFGLLGRFQAALLRLLLLQRLQVLRRADFQVLLQERLQMRRVFPSAGHAQHDHRHGLVVAVRVAVLGRLLLLVAVHGRVPVLRLFDLVRPRRLHLDRSVGADVLRLVVVLRRARLQRLGRVLRVRLPVEVVPCRRHVVLRIRENPELRLRELIGALLRLVGVVSIPGRKRTIFYSLHLLRIFRFLPKAAVDRPLRILRRRPVLLLNFNLQIASELLVLLVQLADELLIFGRKPFECVRNVLRRLGRLRSRRRLLHAAVFAGNAMLASRGSADRREVQRE